MLPFPPSGMLAGDIAVNKEAAKKLQVQLLGEAEQTCQTATAQLASSGAESSNDAKTGMRAELSSLADNLPALRKVVENQEVGVCTNSNN